MAFRLDRSESMEDGVRRVAHERLDDALDRLEGLATASADEVEDSVHEVRKRCKELRGLIRLVRPALGSEYGRANRALRDAADELSSIRDAQALRGTFADLREAEGDAVAALDAVEQAQAERADEAGRALGAGDERVARAHRRLALVRRRTDHWALPDDVTAVREGLRQTYGRGRRGLRRAMKRPSDARMHEWRKRVKYLWYQTRLLEPTAPSALGPLVERLDDLGRALGDDHDLAVLVAGLQADGDRFGGGDEVRVAVDLARTSQADLRERAFALGARIYAEQDDAFADRIGSYWEVDRRLGAERAVGSIADLAALHEERDEDPRSGTVERERKFLVAEPPTLGDEGDRIRQGYVAVDGTASVRVRERSGSSRTLTIKAGSGATRTELEWSLDRVAFDALWPLAEGRRIDKVRHHLPVGDHTAEIDVFAGRLEGLWLVEVEFDSAAAMDGFEPPAWFGAEVTGDARYTNASLAVEGPVPEAPAPG